MILNDKMALRGILLSSVVFAGGWAQAAEGPDAAASGDIETIIVSGNRVANGAGLIKNLESPKSASMVSREFIEDQPAAAANPLQLINLAPGVNSNGRDPTGTGRSAISVRGFQSNQIGLMLDGVPVNDSGTFNVFAQEYIDAENLAEVYIQQGAGDADTPNVGETGGNIGMIVEKPAEDFHVKAVLGGGSYDYVRGFARIDSGALPDGTKAFLSYSNAHVHVWRGEGTTERQHVDSQIVHPIGDDSRLSLSAFYNTAETYSYQALTRAQLSLYGYKFNFATQFAPIVPAGATTPENDNNSAAFAPRTLLQRSNYYLLTSNPFENLVVTAKANLKLTEQVRFDLQPYLWYGFGAGGTGTYVNESNSALLGTPMDLNHDGNSRDNLVYYNPFSQQQVRPGVMARLKWAAGPNELVAGLQWEDGQLREWKPLIAVDGQTGRPADLWPNFANGVVRRADGSLARTQDQDTDTRIVRPFLVDTLTLFEDSLALTAGIQHSDIDRTGVNFLPLAQRTAGNVVAPTNPHLDQAQWVPSFGAVYHATDTLQLFASVAKTFRANDNSVLFSPGVNLSTIKPETTVDAEVGTRYADERFLGSATVFNTDYSNRQQSLFDASANTTVSKNIGNVTIRGAELEAGTQPVRGFSFYGSASYTQSRIDNNILIGAGGVQRVLPTDGRQLTDTPKFIFGGMAKYAVDDYFVQLQGKYTGKRYATLANDEVAGGFATFDVSAGWALPAVMHERIRSKLEIAATNILDRHYLGGINFGNNAKVYNGIPVNLPTYEVGAPRFIGAKLTVTY